jgi:hypothetical protein
MAYSVYPAPSSGSDGGTNIEFIRMPDHKYEVSAVDYLAGTYSLAMTVANKTATIQFFDANGSQITEASLSGLTPVVVNVATPAKKIRAFQPLIQSKSGAVTASIEFKGEQLISNTFSGTVQTITSTQAVSINGTAYVIVIGGGGAGKDTGQHSQGGGGGGSGGVAELYATNWSGAYTVTIGQGATATQANENSNSYYGGTTTVTKTGFSIGATGGGNGGRGYNANGDGGIHGSGTGTFDYQGGAYGGMGHRNHLGRADAGQTYGWRYQHAKAGGVQGGGGGWQHNADAIDLFNGLAGTGKTSASHATGYGNGGGGWWHVELAGNGSQGVVYIITGLQEV